VRLDPLSLSAIDELAKIAVIIHGTPVDDDHRPRPYVFWVPDDLHVPSWTSRPRLWQRAIQLFDRDPPPTKQGLVHCDFHQDAELFWSVSDILGFLPDPAVIMAALIHARPDLTGEVVRERLERLLMITLGETGC
jgi:hypothetical protein